MLEKLRNRLIVSCQPVPHGPLDRSDIVSAYALAVIAGGASGLRIEGIANVAAVRAVTKAPIIGLIKRNLSDFPVRITPYLEDVDILVHAGADIVAFDATFRERPVPVSQLIEQIHQHGALAMADCSTAEEAEHALGFGSDIIGTTLSGYTGEKVPEHPDLDLVRKLAPIVDFLIAEGRYHSPLQAAEALRSGAQAVVVGSAITRPEHITSWFAQAISDQTGGRP